MTKVPAEMMREFVKSQKFTSTEDIMAAMKDMFKDVLQQVMECELADELGYENEYSAHFEHLGRFKLNTPVANG